MAEKIKKQPVQKRSIEKRNQILDTGFQLITQNGYHNTTTDDIARAAGISTGIIYRYFSDKKELLLAALGRFISSMEEAYFNVQPSEHSKDLRFILTTILDRFVALHINHKDIHEELESLRRSDKEINDVYSQFDALLISYMKNALPDDLKQIDHLEERVCLCIQFLENYCHLVIQGSDLDLGFMKAKAIQYSMDILTDSAC